MDFYKDCSYIAPGVKTGPARGHKFEHGNNKRKLWNIIFSETRRDRALIFGMLHLLLDLKQDCSYDVPGFKLALLQGSQNWNTGTKMENFIFFFSETGSPSALMFCMYYLLESWPLPSLFIWCPWGSNWPRPGGHKFEHGNKEGKL